MVLDAALAANNAVSKKENDDKEETKGAGGFNNLSFLLSIITEWIIPIVLAILMWLAEILFGKSTKKKKKKKA